MSLNKLFADNQHAPRRYEINAKAEDAEVFIYDAIGGFWGIQASQFVKDLKAIKSPVIHLRVNSPGGEVDAARAISTAIAQHPARVIAHVDGLAASSASFIILAADEIEMSAGAFVMVHAPWSMTVGNAADHITTAELLNKYADAMAQDYMRRTGKDEATVRGWMDAETWFTAQEAVDAGLADRIIETTAAKNQWNLSAYRHAPAALCAAEPVAQAAVVTPPNEVQGTAPDDATHKETQMVNPNEQNTGQTQASQTDAIAAAVQAETLRASEINRIGALAGFKHEDILNAIKNKTTVEAFKDMVIEAKIATDQATDTRIGHTASVIRDERETRRALGTSAILNRIDPSKYKVENGNDYRGMGVRRMAEEVLEKSGVSTRGLNNHEFCVKAFQSTSDFPFILENSVNKVLLDAYGIAPTTYKIWTRPSTANDFKTLSRVRKSEAPVLDLLPEGGEIKLGTMSESRETYSLATYAKALQFTREMLINDDISAFADVTARMGRAAARLENKTVYTILTANAAMADSNNLFSVAHANTGTGVIGNTGLDAMFVAMGQQKDLDGVSFLGIQPRWLLTSLARRMTAMQQLSESSISVAPNSRNMFAGMLELVSDPELTTAAPWYGVADTGDVEYCYLAGAPGPQMYRTENDNNTLGVRFNVYLDFAAKAVGWKGLYYSTGS